MTKPALALVRPDLDPLVLETIQDMLLRLRKSEQKVARVVLAVPDAAANAVTSMVGRIQRQDTDRRLPSRVIARAGGRSRTVSTEQAASGCPACAGHDTKGYEVLDSNH